jgi:hypothetical protein
VIIKVSNFGDILISHLAGREAFLMAKAYVFKELKADENPSVKATLKTVLSGAEPT